jgi:hypothetical protein
MVGVLLAWVLHAKNEDEDEESAAAREAPEGEHATIISTNKLSKPRAGYSKRCIGPPSL